MESYEMRVDSSIRAARGPRPEPRTIPIRGEKSSPKRSSNALRALSTRSKSLGSVLAEPVLNELLLSLQDQRTPLAQHPTQALVIVDNQIELGFFAGRVQDGQAHLAIFDGGEAIDP